MKGFDESYARGEEGQERKRDGEVNKEEQGPKEENRHVGLMERDTG